MIHHPFFLEHIDTEVGDVSLLTDLEGRVRALEFPGYEARMSKRLRVQYGKGYTVGDAPEPTAAAHAVRAYFEGDLAAIDAVPTVTAGTCFQREVWLALRALRAGETITYVQLAWRVARPTAVRAVGQANGANPIAIIVPCHRVVGSRQGLVGYGGGVERKRWLLAHEERWSGVPRAEG